MEKGALSVEVSEVHIPILLVQVAPEPMLIPLFGRLDSLGTYCRCHRMIHRAFVRPHAVLFSLCAYAGYSTRQQCAAPLASGTAEISPSILQ